MEDKNNLIVYCEYDEGRVADVSLELLTKGRQLATQLGCRLEAVVLGDKLDGIEKQVMPYGVDLLYKVQDDRLWPYTSLPPRFGDYQPVPRNQTAGLPHGCHHYR